MVPQDGKKRDGALAAAVLVIALGVLGLLVLPYVPAFAHGLVPSLLVVLIVAAGVWLALRLLGPVYERVTATKTGSYAQARWTWGLVSYAVLGGTLIALALTFLGDLTSTAMGLGLLGAALAFVLQKPLLNIVGWFLIHYRQVYRIGDRIEVANVRGYVTDVNLMFTDLQEFGNWMHGDTFTGRIVTVPNSAVVEGATWNYTRDFPLVWDEVEVLVTYESDVEVAKRIMIDAAMEVVGRTMFENYERYRRHLVLRDLDRTLITTPEIRMDFAESGVKVWVLYFCTPEQRRRVKAAIVEKIWRRFSEDPRVELAYPHLSVVSGGKTFPGEVPDAPEAPEDTRFVVPEPPKPKRRKGRGPRSRA